MAQSITLAPALAEQLAKLADNEDMQIRVAKYIERLFAREKKPDPTLMTKEEFDRTIATAKQQIAEGKYAVYHKGDSLDDILKQRGYI